jgi:hypothetical protein
MKAYPIKYAVNTIVFLAISVWTHAETAAHDQILRDRDATLSKIVQLQESSLSDGTGHESAVFAARLALHSFRRDIASSPVEKISEQELIVSLCGKRLTSVTAQLNSGVGNAVEVLLMTDQLLQAKQVLEELKAGALKG